MKFEYEADLDIWHVQREVDEKLTKRAEGGWELVGVTHNYGSFQSHEQFYPRFRVSK